MLKRKNLGLSLLELVVASTLFLSIASMTTVMYRNALKTMNHSSNRMDARQRIRVALERVTVMLASTFVPPLPTASGPLERPLAPYPSDNPARTNALYDPLSAGGPGNDSLLFYSPSDLFGPGTALPDVPGMQTHLYELRLSPNSRPDPTGRGRISRDLILTQMSLPATLGGAVTPLPGKTPRVIARALSDFRMKSLAGAGVQLHVEAQDTEWKNDSGQHNTFTVTLESRVYFPVLTN